MSQPRMRKVVASGDDGPRAPASVTKASGDSGACTVRPNQETLRSRSKNKIPKSVRYDLENALVGLCDVWFEEIKPHLVRNNIKLHVHGSSAGGDHERPPPPARAAPPALPAPLAPGCSHLDPGAASDHPRRRDASCVGCCSTPPTASRVLCARLHTPSRRPLSPLLSVPQTPRECAQIQSHNCEEKQLERPRTRRKKRSSQPQPKPSWRVPRLCRTYSVPSPAATGNRMRRIASHLPPQPPHDHYYQFIVPRRESVRKNKTTQTKQPLPCVSTGCQWEEPGPSRSPGAHSPGSHNRGTRSPALRSLGSRSPGTKSTPCSPNPRKPTSHSTAPCSPISCSPTPCSHTPCSPGSSSHDRASPALSLPRHVIFRLTRPEPTVAVGPPLFQDDLIDIIGERNDKRLRLLYSSPEKDDYPSFMNLFPIPSDRQEKPGGLKKNPPWR